jgi:hypothetical protein
VKPFIGAAVGIAFVVAVVCLAGCPLPVPSMDCHSAPTKETPDDNCLSQHFLAKEALDHAVILPVVTNYDFAPKITVLRSSDVSLSKLPSLTLRSVVLRI